MTRLTSNNVSFTDTSRMARCVAKLAEKLEAGEAVDLRELCADCPEFREQLEMLLPTLEAVVDLDATLAHSQSPGQRTKPELADEMKGVLGDFRILRELGRGGMGVVYEAEQLSIGRRVALKVLPFAAMLDRQQLNRFKNEARAAGTLDHPNIVAIHSVGCERGVHYYAMQLIEGQSLAELIGQLRKESGRAEEQQSSSGAEQQPSNNPTAALPPSSIQHPASSIDTQPLAALPTLQAPRSTLPAISSREYYRAVARLGIQAAEALDHAHQNGILHRDIKPANLLVDDTGKLWITDFGLARIEQDAGMTMTGDLLGTLRYMSPEQALAKRVVVDHRSDVYSLGVTLYELFTLQPAYVAADRQELLRQIAFDEPRKPRQLNHRIPQDLETVILKAIEKNPADRYMTSQELADDLLRFMNDQPVRAKRPSLFGVARRWSRRNRALVALATASGAILLAAVMLVLAVSNARIRHESVAKEAALVQKDAALAAARKAVDEMYTGLAEAWLDRPNLTGVQYEYLKKALAFYQDFAQQQDSNPQARQKSIQALLRVGAIQQRLGKFGPAESALIQAVHQSDDLVLKYPDRREFHFDQVAGHLELASLYRRTARPKDADREVDRAQAHLNSLRGFKFTNDKDRQKLGLSLDKLARELFFRRRLSEAEAASQSALEVWEELVDEFPGQQEYRMLLAEHYKSYGEHVDWWGGNEKKAEDALQKAVALFYPQHVLRSDGQVRRGLAEALARLAAKLSVAERDDVAQKMYRRAEILLEDLVVDFPEIVEDQEQLAKLLDDMAADDLRRSRFHNAERRSSRALALYEKLVDQCPEVPAYEMMIGACEFKLIFALTKQEKYDQALRICEQGLSRPPAQDLGTGFDLRDMSGMDITDLAWDIVAAVIGADITRQAAASVDSHPALEAAPSSEPTGAEVNDQLTKRKLIKAVTELMLLRARDEGRPGGMSALLSCAPAGLREPELALQIAKPEMDGAPTSQDGKRTLCAALYRTGDLKGAIEAVPPDDGPCQLILAMAHWQQGDRERAQICFDRGSEWLKEFEKTVESDPRKYWHYPTPPMFKQLRAEAATMLGIASPAVR